MGVVKEIITEWGTAKLNKSTGYFRVQSSKDEIHNKYLHHLVWESHYNKKIPDDCVIHHINNLKTDNRIQNLICVPKRVHDSFHSRHRSDETKQKIGKSSFKSYARIVKNGHTSNGKVKYGIRFNKKTIKQSVCPSNLVKWFKSNYPDEVLVIGGIFDGGC